MATRSKDPFKAAEAVFSKKQPELPKSAPLPPGRDQVTLRIDRDVLEYFQGDGPGWQDRVNEALREYMSRQTASGESD